MFVSRAKYDELERCYQKALKALQISGGRLRMEREFNDSWCKKYIEIKNELDRIKSVLRQIADDKFEYKKPGNGDNS